MAPPLALPQVGGAVPLVDMEAAVPKIVAELLEKFGLVKSVMTETLKSFSVEELSICRRNLGRMYVDGLIQSETDALNALRAIVNHLLALKGSDVGMKQLTKLQSSESLFTPSDAKIYDWIASGNMKFHKTVVEIEESSAFSQKARRELGSVLGFNIETWIQDALDEEDSGIDAELAIEEMLRESAVSVSKGGSEDQGDVFVEEGQRRPAVSKEQRMALRE
ncbi:hypothetical protein KJZ99_00030 [bacterium]|nr:hypothetical protein [bacterium]